MSDHNTVPEGYVGMTVTYETAAGFQTDACDDEADGRRIAEGSEIWTIEDADGNTVASSDDGEEG
jgi:hypothetical protein